MRTFTVSVVVPCLACNGIGTGIGSGIGIGQVFWYLRCRLSVVDGRL